MRLTQSIVIALYAVASLWPNEPRQALTPTPYALCARSASGVAARGITGEMLVPGSAAENLAVSDLSGVARNGIVLGEREFLTNHFEQGYVRLGGEVALVPERWRALTQTASWEGFHSMKR